MTEILILITLILQVIFILCVLVCEVAGQKREKRIRQMFDEQQEIIKNHSEAHEQRTKSLMTFLTR